MALAFLPTILACPALPGLTVFGFKAYAIVTYSSILKGLQLTPYGYLYTSLNYNEIKLVCVAGFEPATSHFQGEPSDLTDITHR